MQTDSFRKYQITVSQIDNIIGVSWIKKTRLTTEAGYSLTITFLRQALSGLLQSLFSAPHNFSAGGVYAVLANDLPKPSRHPSK